MSVLQRLARGLGSPILRLGQAYDQAAKRHPLKVGLWTTVVKTSVADLFAQKVIERKEEVDWRRNGVFAVFGFAYLGCWQYYLYTKVFTRITPSIQAVVGARGVGPVLTFLDQCVHHPLLYFPAFYLLRGGIAGEQPSSSLAKCRDEMWDNLKALWMVWVPAQLVNFSVVPLHLRIPFVAGVSFAWCVILSVLRGALAPATQRVVEELHHLEENLQAAGEKLHHLEENLHAAGQAASGRLHELGGQVPLGPLEQRVHAAHVELHRWSDRMHLAERMHLADAVPTAHADDGRVGSRSSFTGGSGAMAVLSAAPAAASAAEQRQGAAAGAAAAAASADGAEHQQPQQGEASDNVEQSQGGSAVKAQQQGPQGGSCGSTGQAGTAAVPGLLPAVAPCS